MTTARPARTKRADHVQAWLLARIRGGELRPGDAIPSERELMARLSVGRVSIREAMQNLQRLGLVEIRHGGRPRVRQPTLEQVIQDMGETMRHMLSYAEETFEHFKTARLMFEKQMVRMASTARRPEHITRLREIIAQMDAAKADREQWRKRSDVPETMDFEPDTFISLDGEFHKTIAAMSGNPVLAALGGALFDWLAYFHLSRLRDPGLERLVIEEHSRIVDALEAGDTDLPVGRMAEHLNRASGMYRQYRSTGSAASPTVLGPSAAPADATP